MTNLLTRVQSRLDALLTMHNQTHRYGDWGRFARDTYREMRMAGIEPPAGLDDPAKGWSYETELAALKAAVRCLSPDESIDEDDQRILEALAASHPRRLAQVEIEQAAFLSRHQIGDRLRRLRGIGLTCRPQGERGGETITPLGRDILAKIMGE